jgi:23S rRNA (guanosine2251-2'-O)-methyltransferase
MTILYGLHAIEEALAANRPLERILVARGRGGARVQRIVDSARAARVAVRFVSRQDLDRQAGTDKNQGVVAVSGTRHYLELEELIEQAKAPGLLILLDGVEDPRNLGAILRTACCAGASGVILPQRRAAGITPAVEKVSAGASAYLPVARVTNLSRALERLKEAGYWLVGLDEQAEQPFTGVDFTGAVGLVFGGEGKGLHQHVRVKCDFVVSIPTVGAIGSLNVSVAAGVVLYEAVRQRSSREGPQA